MNDLRISLEEIRHSMEVVENSGHVIKTPMLKDAQFCFSNSLKASSLHFKLESMQTTGSFKIRGALNQLDKLKPQLNSCNKGIITHSSGNYGKGFATIVNGLNIPNRVLMPNCAPVDRVTKIRNLGSQVEQYENLDIIEKVVANYCKDGMLFINSLDDLDLIRAYGVIALEIIQSVPNPDIVIVPCGGGSLLSGISTAMRLVGLNSTKIYGVNPMTANSMYRSFQIGQPTRLTDPKSVAVGLWPWPSESTYACCKTCVDDILLISDDEIIEAVRSFFNIGLIVEPAGAASLAALMTGKVPVPIEGKTIVVVVSGGNITMNDMQSLLNLV